MLPSFMNIFLSNKYIFAEEKIDDMYIKVGVKLLPDCYTLLQQINARNLSFETFSGKMEFYDSIFTKSTFRTKH